MKTRFAAVASMLILGVISASAQDGRLDDAAVQAALAVGADDDDDDFKDLFANCTASPGWREDLGGILSAGLIGEEFTQSRHRVTFTSHYGLIAMVAAERKAKSMDPPPPSEITDELRSPVLRLWLEPHDVQAAVDGTFDLTASITHVVLRPEGRDEGVVQPLSFETEVVEFSEFSNRRDAEFEQSFTRALATFPADAALAASEDRDLEVVVMTPLGERRCNVDNDDIRRMFKVEH